MKSNKQMLDRGPKINQGMISQIKACKTMKELNKIKKDLPDWDGHDDSIAGPEHKTTRRIFRKFFDKLFS